MQLMSQESPNSSNYLFFSKKILTQSLPGGSHIFPAFGACFQLDPWHVKIVVKKRVQALAKNIFAP